MAILKTHFHVAQLIICFESSFQEHGSRSFSLRLKDAGASQKRSVTRENLSNNFFREIIFDDNR